MFCKLKKIVKSERFQLGVQHICDRSLLSSLFLVFFLFERVHSFFVVVVSVFLFFFLFFSLFIFSYPRDLSLNNEFL